MGKPPVQMFRTLLFAPGSRPELLAKAQTGNADALIFDLEDSVPANAKEQARRNVAQALAAGLRKPMYLRINNPRAGDFRSDLAVLQQAPSLANVMGVILPKADDAQDVHAVAAVLDQIEAQRQADAGKLAIVPLIETCLGLRNTFELCRASPRVAGVALASAEEGDFMVDLGGRWTPNSAALDYPRSKMVVDARAAGIQWIVDGVFMNLKNLDALRTECLLARELGCTGKMAIHPTQVEVMHEVFSPSAEEVEYAQGLMAAFREGEARGIGAVKYRGMMVDYANVRLAERTLSLVNHNMSKAMQEPHTPGVLPEIGPHGSVPSRHYAPLRTMADVEAIQAIPLEQRITRWDFALNLLDGCRHDPQRAALHVTHNGNIDGELITWTFAHLEHRSIQIANLLRASGVGPGDAVAIVSPTVPGLFATMIGGLLAARPFPINWMLDAHALGDLIRRSGVKVVIALGPTPGFSIWENVSAALASMDTPPPLFTLHDPFAPAHPHDLLSAAAAHPQDRLAFARETAQRTTIACYVHSGGTTGHPKIVQVTHGGMVFRQWAANQCMAFTPDDVILSDTPLFHIGGLLVRGLVSTADGHTTVVPSMHGARDKTYIANYWRYVERFGVTQISGVPTTLSVLAKNPPTTENIATLRPYFATGSTAMAQAVQDRIFGITGARTLQTYGLTENTSHVSVDPRDGDIRRGCSGLRVPYTTVRIAQVDGEGRVLRECQRGEIGMVMVRSPGVATGYLDPAQNLGVFLPDGWLVTGDLGSVDADGYVRISGRQKDIIIRSGHNIEPGLIEDALLQSPWVAQAAAIGKPDAHAGELPIAYVELHPGAQVSAEELLRYAAERIPERPAVPKEIIFVDKLPLTAVGKPLKHLLQLETAKRVFTEVLHPVPGVWELGVTNTGGSGLKLTLRMKEATAEARQQADAILSAYSTPYTIEVV